MARAPKSGLRSCPCWVNQPLLRTFPRGSQWRKPRAPCPLHPTYPVLTPQITTTAVAVVCLSSRIASVSALCMRPPAAANIPGAVCSINQQPTTDLKSRLIQCPPLGMQNAMQCTRPPLPPHDPSFLDTRNNKPFLDCNQTKLVPYRVLLFAVKQSLLLDVRIFQAQTNHGTLSHLSYLPLSRCQP